jgi:hypothetical protein
MNMYIKKEENNTKKQIIEYLYIDHNRLNSYFEQISNPQNVGRVLNYEVGLKPLPFAEIKTNVHLREYTTYEKIKKLMEYLKENDLIATKIPYPRDLNQRAAKNKIFATGQFEANRIFIPPNEKIDNFNGLAIWYSSFDKETTADPYTINSDRSLFLLEDFPRSDRDGFGLFSSYSIFNILCNDLQSELDMTVLSDGDQNNKENQELKWIDPMTSLKKLGAVIGAKRKIWVLFRIRASFIELHKLRSERIFGYPIVISDLMIT